MNEKSKIPCRYFFKYMGKHPPKCNCLPCEHLYQEVQYTIKNISKKNKKAVYEKNL